MDLDPSIDALRDKWRRLDEALSLIAQGRLCMEQDCLDRTVVAVRVRRGDQSYEVGLCQHHTDELGGGLHLTPGWVSEGTRPLGEDEILDGPLS